MVVEPVDDGDLVNFFLMPSLTLCKTLLLVDFPHLDPLFTRSHTNIFPRFHFLHKRVSMRKLCPEPVGEYIREVSDRSAQLAGGASLLGGWLASGLPRAPAPWALSGSIPLGVLPLFSSILLSSSSRPRAAPRLFSGAFPARHDGPPAGRFWSAERQIPPAEGRRFRRPLVVTGADGICGLLAVGYLSFPDSRGYGRYGFRPSDVPCLLASTWSGMLQPRGTPIGVPRVPVADHALGNSVGAIRMVPGTLRVRLRRPVGDRVSFTPAVISTFSVPPAWGVRPGLFGGSRQGRIWLILPVVICLSQRLSHACLSISTLVP